MLKNMRELEQQSRTEISPAILYETMGENSSEFYL